MVLSGIYRCGDGMGDTLQQGKAVLDTLQGKFPHASSEMATLQVGAILVKGAASVAHVVQRSMVDTGSLCCANHQKHSMGDMMPTTCDPSFGLADSRNLRRNLSK